MKAIFKWSWTLPQGSKEQLIHFYLVLFAPFRHGLETQLIEICGTKNTERLFLARKVMYLNLTLF